MNQSIELLECDGCSIEEVETKYGKMWKIRINKIGLTDEEIEEREKEFAETSPTHVQFLPASHVVPSQSWHSRSCVLCSLGFCDLDNAR
jgi:hypothetical protein